MNETYEIDPAGKPIVYVKAVDVADLPGNRKGHFVVPNILGVTKRHPH